MPKETFFNLKEEKQQRILMAALHEIGEYGYDKASVTRIVKEAGIATGSFYQYFEDLDDLFVYIGREGGRLKAHYMQLALAENPKRNLENFIRAMYRGGLRFGLEHPEYFKAAQSFLLIKNTQLMQRMYDGIETSEIYIWLFQFVGEAIANGDLPKGITADLFFRLLTSINTTIIEYLLAQKPGGEMDANDLEMLCELGVQILLHGVRNHSASEG